MRRARFGRTLPPHAHVQSDRDVCALGLGDLRSYFGLRRGYVSVVTTRIVGEQDVVATPEPEGLAGWPPQDVTDPPTRPPTAEIDARRS
jgi:hypothetical protein